MLILYPTRNLCMPQSVDVAANTPEEFTTCIRAEIAKWKKVAQEAGIQLDY